MHKAQQHKDAVYPFACTSCEYHAPNQQNLIAHLKLHSDEKPYPCHICNYRAKGRTGVTAHLKRKNHTAIRAVRINYKCGLCNHQTSAPSDLRDHIVTHIRSPDLIRLELICMCQYVTKFEEIPIHVNDHVKNIVNSEIGNLLIQFVCNVMNGVDDRLMLPLHPNVPLEYKNTNFNYGATQGSPPNWLNDDHHFAPPPPHHAVNNLPPIHTINSANTFHTDANHTPYDDTALPPNATVKVTVNLTCTFCNYVACDEYDLNYHVSTHSTVFYDNVTKMPVWYNCCICSYKGSSEHEIMVHMHMHVDLKHTTSIYGYNCEICGYSGNSHSDLEVHKIQHSDEEPVECKICGYIAITMGDLELHMVMHPQPGDLDSDSEGVDSPYASNCYDQNDFYSNGETMTNQQEEYVAASAPNHI